MSLFRLADDDIPCRPYFEHMPISSRDLDASDLLEELRRQLDGAQDQRTLNRLLLRAVALDHPALADVTVLARARLEAMKQSPQDDEPPAKVCRNSSVEHPRLFAHFLPKFENQQEARLLSGSSLAGARCLAVAKKHSGHLVMAPPFYSKNGCANLYSRLGELVLRTHFDAVWPDQDDAFERWWQHAHEHSLCYSFECVVPRIAGDHGATPRAAYMVLTCVAQAGDFLSPAQLLSLGASWRLPLNQVTYVPWELAAALESELHSSRWTLGDSGTEALLAGAQQCFLRHSDTQGEVLEGFVLFALDQPLEALAPLIEAYEAAVAHHRSAALEAALRLGESCLCREGWLLDRLSQPSAREPRRAVLSQEQAWQRACESADGPLARLFRTLRAAYSHRVVLKQYEYLGKLQLQIDVNDDQIFFGWPLHVALNGCAPLFRGMVVQFEAQPEAPALSAALGSGALPVRILGIAKLKCLPYLQRTFGVRNLLPTLLAEGAFSYLQRTAKFFRNWLVPDEHQPALQEVFSGWAREVERLSAAERQQLQQGNYLQFLEPFLRGERRKEVREKEQKRKRAKASEKEERGDERREAERSAGKRASISSRSPSQV